MNWTRLTDKTVATTCGRFQVYCTSRRENTKHGALLADGSRAPVGVRFYSLFRMLDGCIQKGNYLTLPKAQAAAEFIRQDEELAAGPIGSVKAGENFPGENTAE